MRSLSHHEGEHLDHVDDPMGRNEQYGEFLTSHIPNIRCQRSVGRPGVPLVDHS
jgi:hypothetical protein